MSRAKVKSVLAGLSKDSLVRGEIWVAPEVLASLGLPNNATGIAELAAILGADLCFLSCSGPQPVPPQTKVLQAAVAEVHARDLACGIVIDGPWQRLVQSNGLIQLLERFGTAFAQIQQEIVVQTTLIHEEIRAWVRADVDLVLLADDLAYNEGLYFSPVVFNRLLLPNYRQFLQAANDLQVPLGFHSDGNLMRLLPTLVEIGFSFFSLETEAMDLAQVQCHFRDRAGLIAGIRAAWLNPDRAAWRLADDDMLSEIATLTHRGRLILGSACGLYHPASLAALREIYRITACLS